MQETTIRRVHAPYFGLILLASIVALAISASLVKHYNDGSYPNNSYRDRIRILLVASIWTVFFAAYLLFGTLFAASRVIFGIAAHLFGLLIGFLLFMIGAAALTALTAKADLSKLDRGNIVRGLVAISWIDTILLFVALVSVFILGIKSRSGAGMRRSTLVDA